MSYNQRADEPAILYVDDEEQALKYFKRSFEDNFKILTACVIPNPNLFLMLVYFLNFTENSYINIQ